MCGICGSYDLYDCGGVSQPALERMVKAIAHRGPEQSGIYCNERVGLGHARLSIIDLPGGRQPIANEDGSIRVIFNGEIFNYPELKEELLKKGHRFGTRTDTEVLVHLYEEHGSELLQYLNGQFAFALWDGRRQQLLLARDRLGVRPLYYTVAGGTLLFGSEIKALLADVRVKAALDPVGLDQLFTFWATLPPRTVFRKINELPAAHFLTAKNGVVSVRRYWQLAFPDAGGPAAKSEAQYAEELHALLLDATRIRLRADVPVAAYLSGGLDSSFISAVVKKHFNRALKTFSVSFSDGAYDESAWQKQMADFLGTEHRTAACSCDTIGGVMPEIVRHAEKPLVRTAPAPMYLLARLVRENGIKVVLTGEGADEMLGGYDLFREMKIRRFWAKVPSSKLRPLLLQKLYGYLPDWPRRAPAFLEAFYRVHLAETAKPYYSHIPRWTMTAGIKEFYSEELKHALHGYDALEEFAARLPERFGRWDGLAQAQYIEIETLLSGNLLSSQGDRMAMAHAVEGRYPFLDHRVVEYCAALPPRLKLKGMNEKYLLKKIAAPYLPAGIAARTKQAYRAPDSASFFSGRHGYVDELLEDGNVRRNGCFDPVKVERLAARCRKAGSMPFGARHNMAVTGILSTLLLDRLFMQSSFQPSAVSHQLLALNDTGTAGHVGAQFIAPAGQR